MYYAKDTADHLRDGDTVWAYAFDENVLDNLEAKPSLHQTPIFGVISRPKYGHHTFIPYSKDGTKLCTSHAINIKSRKYAATEEDAWFGYMSEINCILQRHEKRMAFLRTYFDNVPNLAKYIHANTGSVCRFLCTLSPTKPNMDSKYILPPSLPNIPLHPYCTLPNRLSDVVWHMTSGHHSDSIDTAQMTDVRPATILIEGYNKDSDTYDTLHAAASYEDAKQIVDEWTPIQQKTDCFRNAQGEPYDWFIITDTST